MNFVTNLSNSFKYKWEYIKENGIFDYIKMRFNAIVSPDIALFKKASIVYLVANMLFAITLIIFFEYEKIFIISGIIGLLVFYIISFVFLLIASRLSYLYFGLSIFIVFILLENIFFEEYSFTLMEVISILFFYVFPIHMTYLLAKSGKADSALKIINFFKKNKLLKRILVSVVAAEVIENEMEANVESVDSFSFDSDGDGIADTIAVDTDGDGNYDSFVMDTDGDGSFDSFISDADGDGHFDSMGMDTDGDGQIDIVSTDLDGDGSIDITSMDTDNDGSFDTIV